MERSLRLGREDTTLRAPRRAQQLPGWRKQPVELLEKMRHCPGRGHSCSPGVLEGACTTGTGKASCCLAAGKGEKVALKR